MVMKTMYGDEDTPSFVEKLYNGCCEAFFVVNFLSGLARAFVARPRPSPLHRVRLGD
jgi:hypothetical protein